MTQDKLPEVCGSLARLMRQREGAYVEVHQAGMLHAHAPNDINLKRVVMAVAAYNRLHEMCDALLDTLIGPQGEDWRPHSLAPISPVQRRPGPHLAVVKCP